MSSIELKDIHNLTNEQASKLLPHGPLDLIGNGEIKVPMTVLLNFLDSICLKATFKDKLLVKAGEINPDLEKFIECKETPLGFKKYFLDFVNPSLSEWFYFGEERTNRTYVHFFKNGKFLALCVIGSRITTYSDCSLTTYTKEFNRLITSALTSNVACNISSLLNRRKPEVLDIFPESMLSKRSVSEEELLSNERYGEVGKMFSGWVKVETFRDNVEFIALNHHKSNLVVWLNKIDGLLCVFKVGTKDSGANFTELKMAEKALEEILNTKQVVSQDQTTDTPKLTELTTDKEVVLSMIKKLEETVLSFDDNFEANLLELSDVIRKTYQIVDEVDSISERIRLIDRFKSGRERRLFSSDISDRYQDSCDDRERGRYSRVRMTYRDRTDYREDYRDRNSRHDATKTRDRDGSRDTSPDRNRDSRDRDDYDDRGSRGRSLRDRDED